MEKKINVYIKRLNWKNLKFLRKKINFILKNKLVLNLKLIHINFVNILYFYFQLEKKFFYYRFFIN
jgi:hypothetical protein